MTITVNRHCELKLQAERWCEAIFIVKRQNRLLRRLKKPPRNDEFTVNRHCELKLRAERWREAISIVKITKQIASPAEKAASQ